MELWQWIIVCVVVFASTVGVYHAYDTHMTEQCIEHADTYGLPCLYGTVRWDEDECECSSSASPGVELEFRP